MVVDDEVIWAFRYLFGREPESGDTVRAHRNFDNWKSLREALIKTPEFAEVASKAQLPNKWIMTDVMDGQRRLWLNLSDHYVSLGCLFDNYEAPESDFVRKNLQEGQRFVDIGANIGWFTLLASTIVGSRGEIFSFEPHPTTFKYLEKSVQDNALDSVIKLHNIGLSDHSGSAYIVNAVGTNNPGGSYVSAVEQGHNTESNAIALETLDSLSLPKIDFIKIDVEGFEPRVIRGAERTLSESRPIILAEINPEALLNLSATTPDEFIASFLNRNYEVFIVDAFRGGESIKSYPPDWRRDIMNVALVPVEKTAFF